MRRSLPDQVNPFTGKPITGEADYRAWLTEKNRRDAQQQRLQAERRLSDAGLPADALRQIISQEVERHPAVQQARQATMQAALQSARAVRQRAQEAIGRSLTAIAAEFPEIKSLEDIAKMPTAGRFNELVQKGVGIEDAFSWPTVRSWISGGGRPAVRRPSTPPRASAI